MESANLWFDTTREAHDVSFKQEFPVLSRHNQMQRSGAFFKWLGRTPVARLKAEFKQLQQELVRYHQHIHQKYVEEADHLDKLTQMLGVKGFKLDETKSTRGDAMFTRLRPWVENQQKIHDLKEKIEGKNLAFQEHRNDFYTVTIKFKEVGDTNSGVDADVGMTVARLVVECYKIEEEKRPFEAQLRILRKEQAPLDNLMYGVVHGNAA